MTTERSTADDWRLTDDLHAETGKGDPFAAAIRATRMPMLITDPRRPDHPIVFVNDAFLHLTGYLRSEVVGRNCRFLQGPETDAEAVATIRNAIQQRESVNIDILNYRKDGTAFWNALYISPVSNEAGELQFFFASQLDVTDRKETELRANTEKERFERAVRARTLELQTALEAQTALLHEVDHRVKNNLQMVSSLIVMQSRTIPDEGIRNSLRSMLERVEALSTVHRRLYQSEDVSRFDVADFVRDLVTDLVAASGRGIGVKLDLEPVNVPAERAASIALIVNELVTNSVKHAFRGRAEGTIHIVVRARGERFSIDVIDDGTGMGNVTGAKSFGLRLIQSLAKQLQADVSFETLEPGTRVTVSMPIDRIARPA